MSEPTNASEKPLRIVCIDSNAAPLFWPSPDGIHRQGYEPEAAALVASRLGRSIEWVFTAWEKMLPMVVSGEVDAVWCGQGIIPSRLELVNYTRPYAVFDETVLVRRGDGARTPEDLNGYRIAAVKDSANLSLALTFPGIVPVTFGASDDVFGDMLEALRTGDVEAVIDDDVVTVPLGEDPDFEVAFTVPTHNRWGVGVAKNNPELLAALNGALSDVIADGSLGRVWATWMPQLPFPLTVEESA